MGLPESPENLSITVVLSIPTYSVITLVLSLLSGEGGGGGRVSFAFHSLSASSISSSFCCWFLFPFGLMTLLWCFDHLSALFLFWKISHLMTHLLTHFIDVVDILGKGYYQLLKQVIKNLDNGSLIKDL